MPLRVIGLGQDAAGDDGVGLAVARALHHIPGVEAIEAPDAAALIPLLATTDPVVVVDAALGLAPGDVVEIDLATVRHEDPRPVSTHGLGVLDAIALAAALHPETLAPSLRLVAVGIARPAAGARGLSPVVAAAVPRAVAAVLT